MKIRVTIDTDDVDFSDDNSVERGVFGIDLDGVYHSWYGSHTYKVYFEDVEIIECKHYYPEKIRNGDSWEYSNQLTCIDCGQKRTIEQKEIDECKNPECYHNKYPECSYIKRVVKQSKENYKN